MATPPGSILPSSYFDGLSQLWGACAYIASAIVAAGFVFSTAATRRDPVSLIRLIIRVFIIALSIAFLREWLMRLNDVVNAFGDYMGIDPSKVDDRFIKFISGTSPSSPNKSVWDVIWDTGSVGTAISYALLWLFGWLSWGVEYIVKLVGDILLSAGWSLSPLFLSFFMIRPMTSVALRYVMGLVALVCWPFGWVLASVVTNAMLDAAATASLVPVVLPSSASIAPALTVLLIGAWMLVSSALAPFVTTKVLLMGINPVSAFAQGAAGVGHAVIAGAFGGAATAMTGGASAAGVIASAAVGAMASGAESAARGGGSARTTGTITSGLSGLYGAAYGRRQAATTRDIAASFQRMASAAEAIYEGGREQREVFHEVRRRMNRQRTERDAQPHTDNPNEVALLIEQNARK
ncbi:MAG TPA: hypothetical protein VFT72_19080 [Opitutaceae bacterium]|nr:hypothetical protein [Opitutaceae bacterium]